VESVSGSVLRIDMDVAGLPLATRDP